MTTTDLIKKIQKLPISERLYVVEQTMQSIREQEDKELMSKAAEHLVTEYEIDTELTVFTDIDFDNFYETK